MKTGVIMIMGLLTANVYLYADTWHIVSTNAQGVVTGCSTEQTATIHELGPNEFPADYQFPTNEFKYWKTDGTNWMAMTEEEQAAVDKPEKDRKQMLAALVGIYKTFLKDEWTVLLRARGVIAQDKEITVSNTGAGENMLYLMTLRAMDTEANKPTYSYFKNEFETFRNNIERLGGDMSNLDPGGTYASKKEVSKQSKGK